MTPVRRRSADAARRERRGDAAHYVAHHLSSEEIIIIVLRAIPSENTMFNLAFHTEGRVGNVESEGSPSESVV